LAHGQGLIHRDMKPQNIMMDYDGKKVLVKLLDFGLAESSRLPGQEEEVGTVMGSVHTIAPEQLVGEPASILTDIYSLACVYYYALTGHYPYEGNSVEGIVQGHLHGTFTPLNQRRPAIPPLLAQVIGRMLSKNPLERPESAEKAREQILAITRSAVFHEKDFGLKQFVAKGQSAYGKSTPQTEVIDISKVKKRKIFIRLAWGVNLLTTLAAVGFIYWKYFKI